MSEENVGFRMTGVTTEPTPKPRPRPKRQRRDYAGELTVLQSRVEMAIKLLEKAPESPLVTVAIEILQGD